MSNLEKIPWKRSSLAVQFLGNVVEATGSPTRCHCHVPSAPSTISQGQVQHFSKDPTQESMRIKKVLQVVSDLVSIVIVMSTWIHWILLSLIVVLYCLLCVVIVQTYDLREKRGYVLGSLYCMHVFAFYCTHRPQLKTWEDFERFESDDVQVMLNSEDCRVLRPGVT